MIDEEFFRPRKPVAVIAVGDSGEALLLRAILESLGAAVILHLPGTAEDFLKSLGQGEAAPEYVIISGHGDDRGFVFGSFAPDVDASALTEGSLPASSLRNRVDLPGKVVLSTACRTGTDDFARAFLAGGARAYIAPSDDPDGAAMPLFLHRLFYELLHRRKPLNEAMQRGASFDPGMLSLVLFEQDRAQESQIS